MRRNKVRKDKNLSTLSRRLVNLGLTKLEAKMYVLLVEKGDFTANEIAGKLRIFPQAVYRIAKGLERQNLIGITRTTPITYRALPPNIALPAFVERRETYLQKESKEVTRQLAKKENFSNPTNVTLVLGKGEIFRVGAKMVDKARKEILVISIGEEVPKELLLSMRNAHKRGVTIRFIAHKYDKENKHIIESFKKNGYEARYYPDEKFQLVVFDGRETLQILNNPKNMDERAAVQIFNAPLSKAHRDYFYSVWKKAVKV